MVIISLTISIFTLAFSLFTYFKHDIKIKTQSRLLNAYQIEKIKKEESEQKKANLEANVNEEIGGRQVIKIYNKGRSIARNAEVILPITDRFQIINNPCPIDIRPQNSIEIIVLLLSDSAKFKLVFKWTDEFKEYNEDKQMVQLYSCYHDIR